MNLQVIASPDGSILWVSGALPGSVHDKNAEEWIWGVLAELEAAGLVTLADKGYRGSVYAKIPYQGKNRTKCRKQANRAHARLRAPGERANAQLKSWRILRKLPVLPLARRSARQGHPRFAGPRGITRMEKPHYKSEPICALCPHLTPRAASIRGSLGKYVIANSNQGKPGRGSRDSLVPYGRMSLRHSWPRAGRGGGRVAQLPAAPARSGDVGGSVRVRSRSERP